MATACGTPPRALRACRGRIGSPCTGRPPRGGGGDREAAARCNFLTKSNATVRTPVCLAGYVGFEPANPSARHLIGIAGQFRVRSAHPAAENLRVRGAGSDFAALGAISTDDLRARKAVASMTPSQPQ
jgi:hypothetical protein